MLQKRNSHKQINFPICNEHRTQQNLEQDFYEENTFSIFLSFVDQYNTEFFSNEPCYQYVPTGDRFAWECAVQQRYAKKTFNRYLSAG